MTHRPNPPRPSRPQALALTHRRTERSLVALLVLVVGALIFRATLLEAEDAMLALLAPVVVFLLVASLFAGDDRRRL